MKTRFLILMLFALLSLIVHSQSTHWQRYFSAGLKEDGLDICTAGDGNIYTAGFTNSGNYSAGWLIKLNPLGDTIWTRKISQMEGIFAIEPTPDNGCIVAGRGFNIIKVNSGGDSVWSVPVNAYTINDIIKTSDNNYILCGNTGSWIPYACKISGNGLLIWQRNYSENTSIYLHSVINTNDGGFIFAGTIHNNDNDTGIIIKTDINGSFAWQKKYILNNSKTWFTSIAGNNNSYFISGYSNSPYNVFIIKTDISGDSVKTYSSALSGGEAHIVKVNSNKFFLTSTTGNFSTKIISIDSNLNIIKQLIISPVRTYLQVYNINIYNGDNSGDILLTGATDISQQLSEELYAARIDSALNPPPQIGIKLISSEIPVKFSLSQNYPNPFNPVTKIKFSLLYPSEGGVQSVKLLIYDMLGREIASLIPPLWGGQEGLKPGTYEVTWDAANYTCGVYFYKLVVTDASAPLSTRYTESKKMILIK